MIKILIISDSNDDTTDHVIDWLQWQSHVDIVRINQQDIIQDITLILNEKNCNTYVHIKNNLLDIGLFDTIWYRRGAWSVVFPVKSSQEYFNQIVSFLGNEWSVVKKYLSELQTSVVLSTSEDENRNNKILNLKIAQTVGLSIPDTIVTTSKKELECFFKRIGSIIYKPLLVAFECKSSSHKFSTGGSKLFSERLLNNMNDYFFPSLFQEYIEKDIEIRAFYLKGQFFSMAIFSQQDEKTKIDYRNYNHEKPTRNIPFQLPKEIEEKLDAFMKKSQLETGSIDIIKSIDGRYVFLEVNPVGQFGWVSENCNYYLEQKIAYFLAHGKHAT